MNLELEWLVFRAAQGIETFLKLRRPALAVDKRALIIAAVQVLRGAEMRALCGGDDYVGVYKDLAIERRRMLKAEEKFRPYKPLEYFEQHGKLRQLCQN